MKKLINAIFIVSLISITQTAIAYTNHMDESGNIFSLAEINKTDSDGDGVFDEQDKCPDIFGNILNAGCPVENYPTLDILQTVKSNLKFTQEGQSIDESSKAYLDELAALLIEKPNWKLLVSNLIFTADLDPQLIELSKTYIASVMFYLVEKGVPRKQIVADYYRQSVFAHNSVTSLQAGLEMKFLFE